MGEGRPGTRKNKRWMNGRALVHSLRSAMAACGEDGAALDEEKIASLVPSLEHRPSAFYQLLKLEGPESALDAWAAAEASRRERPRSRPRASTRNGAESSAASSRNEQAVRRAFSDTWGFIRKNSSTRELVTKLETTAGRAFSTPGQLILDSWQLAWDAESEMLDTMSGEPPAGEIEIYGLSASERKVVHQLARVLGLHSESRILDGLLEEVAEGDGKALALRPTRRHCGKATVWAAPFSVAQVLAMA